MRTKRVLSRAGIESTLRFSIADKAFLNGLTKTGLISEKMATEHYYAQRKNGAAKPLSRFVEGGILEKFSVYTPDGEKLVSYRFKNKAIAKSFGGSFSRSSINRSDYHDLLTTEAYFQLDQPDDFRIESNFSKADQALFPCLDQGRYRPDAMATVNGETIYVEADAGHYSNRQIAEKLSQWGRASQLWVQPVSAKTLVPAHAHITTVRV